MYGSILNNEAIVLYNNLTQNLLRNGLLSRDELVQMSYSPNYLGGVQNQSLQRNNLAQPSNVKQEVVTAAKQEAAYEEGLLLDMFSTFCGEQPETAKELSTAFTKFARWIQSSVDKQNNDTYY